MFIRSMDSVCVYLWSTPNINRKELYRFPSYSVKFLKDSFRIFQLSAYVAQNESCRLCSAYKNLLLLFTRSPSNPLWYTSLWQILFDMGQPLNGSKNSHFNTCLYCIVLRLCLCMQHFNGNVSKEWTKTVTTRSHNEQHFLSWIEAVLRSGAAYIWIIWQAVSCFSVRFRSC